MVSSDRHTGADDAARVPQTLFGYRINGVLGHGAGSTIYAAEHPVTREPVAVKHVTRGIKRYERFVDQLVNEYAVAQKIAHPNLRRVIECHVRKNWLFHPTDAILVMELFHGQRLDRIPRPPIPILIGWFIQAAQGLHALHQAGYVHCDTKPNNILISALGGVKVIDLGQACPIGAKKERIQGTADYMAPEQVRRVELSVRTDVFNLGATLYFALTGVNVPTLFTIEKGGNSFLVDRRITSPMEHNAAVPPTLSNLVMECVKTNPAKRPSDMIELALRLETIRFGLEHHQAAAQAHAVPPAPVARAIARSTGHPGDHDPDVEQRSARVVPVPPAEAAAAARQNVSH